MAKKCLTEKQLLRSKDADYMSKEQLDYFRQRLENDRKQALNELEKIKNQISHVDQTADPFDQAANEEIREINLKSIERLTRMIHKIEHAIDNIDTGEYGYCEVTGEKIGLPRLLIRRFSSLSVAAKEAQEHLDRGDSDT